MKNILAVTLFMLASVAWAAAQQPGSAPDAGQATSPSSQAPSQTQPSAPNGQSQAQGQSSNPPVTEGCLGGKDPHYTITDKAGTTYKLNIPANADTSKLSSHIGEPVQVMGDVNTAKAGNATINVQGIGKGMGSCPGGSSAPQSPK